MLRSIIRRKNIILELGILLTLLAAICLFLISQEYMFKPEYVSKSKMIARHHLLCEVLKPGMSMDDVFEILHQAGDFTSSPIGDKSADAQLSIVFLDAKNSNLDGDGFYIGFSDYKYTRAYTQGFDTYERICDFSQVTP